MKQKEKFRSTSLYNNIMYALAGKVVEVLTNKSYETNLKEEILAPLDMKSSNFRHEEVPPGVRRASQYGFTYVGGPLLEMTADKFGYDTDIALVYVAKPNGWFKDSEFLGSPGEWEGYGVGTNLYLRPIFLKNYIYSNKRKILYLFCKKIQQFFEMT